MAFYKITTAIKSYLESDPGINSVNIGTIESIDLSKQTIFPHSQIVIEGAEFLENTISFSLQVVVMDSVYQSNNPNPKGDEYFKGNNNKQDVYNSTLRVINGLQVNLKSGDLFQSKFHLDGNPTATPFENQYGNLVSGWSLSFTVIIPNENVSTCDFILNVIDGGTTIVQDYMKKIVYDKDRNGIVDDSEKLGGELPEYYATNDGLSIIEGILNGHLNDLNNPHDVTPSQIGLGEVDNTSDIDKPVSDAQQIEINTKVSLSGDTMTGTLTAPFVKSQNYAIDNNDLVRLDQLNSLIGGLDWQRSVISFYDFTIPPVDPIDEDRYISSTTAGNYLQNNIYEWDDDTTSWIQTIPNEGYTVWVEDDDTNYTFNEFDWVEFGSTISHNNTTGIQGGIAGEHFHLPEQLHDELTNNDISYQNKPNIFTGTNTFTEPLNINDAALLTGVPYTSIASQLFVQPADGNKQIAMIFSPSGTAKKANIQVNNSSSLTDRGRLVMVLDDDIANIVTDAQGSGTSPAELRVGNTPGFVADGALQKIGFYFDGQENVSISKDGDITGESFIGSSQVLTNNTIGNNLISSINGDAGTIQFKSDTDRNRMLLGITHNLEPVAGRGVFFSALSGETYARFAFDGYGLLGWGIGTNDFDVKLYRESANNLKTDSNLTASTFIKIGGTSSQFLKANGTVDSNSYAITDINNNFSTEQTINSSEQIVLQLNSTDNIGRIAVDAGNNSGILFNTEGVNRWSAATFQKDSGNYDFTFWNSQTQSEGFGLDGDTNDVTFSNNLITNGGIDTQDIIRSGDGSDAYIGVITHSTHKFPGVWLAQPDETITPTVYNAILTTGANGIVVGAPIDKSIFYRVNNEDMVRLYPSGGFAIGNVVTSIANGVDPGKDNLLVEGKISIGDVNFTEKLNVDGNVLATTFKIDGGTSDDILLGDGSTTSLSGVIGGDFVDLTTDQTIDGNKTFVQPIKLGTDPYVPTLTGDGTNNSRLIFTGGDGGALLSVIFNPPATKDDVNFQLRNSDTDNYGRMILRLKGESAELYTDTGGAGVGVTSLNFGETANAGGTGDLDDIGFWFNKVQKAKINSDGSFEAKSFIADSKTNDDILLGDGSTTSLDDLKYVNIIEPVGNYTTTDGDTNSQIQITDGNIVTLDGSTLTKGFTQQVFNGNTDGSPITITSTDEVQGKNKELKHGYYATYTYLGNLKWTVAIGGVDEVILGDDLEDAGPTNVGTMRYRSDDNNSYVDMCMQTDVDTYAWINITQNNW